MTDWIQREHYSPAYAALRDFLREERKWTRNQGSISATSEKRARAALKTLGLTPAEIDDYFKFG